MLKNGVDVFVASKRLGHAMPSITFVRIGLPPQYVPVIMLD